MTTLTKILPEVFASSCTFSLSSSPTQQSRGKRTPAMKGMTDHGSHHKGSPQKHQEHGCLSCAFFSSTLPTEDCHLQEISSESDDQRYRKASSTKQKNIAVCCNPIIPRSSSFQIYKGFLSFLQSCSHLLLPLLCPGELLSLSQLTKTIQNYRSQRSLKQ